MSVKNVTGGKTSTIDINSVTLPDFKWLAIEQTEQVQVWEADKFPAILSKYYFNVPPDLGRLENLDGLRTHYRSLAAKANGGLIKVEVINLKGLAAVEVILKLPLPETGMCYIGSLTIPFKKHSFVLKFQAEESGVTGLRDAVIADQYLREGKVGVDELGRLTGWNRDPYDVDFPLGNRMNLSELEKYDEKFQDHPLSIVRRVLKDLKEGVEFAPELFELDKFKG